MNILGISAFYHDSAACLISNDNILAAAQEERFTRKKHDPSFPSNAIKFCLDESGFSLNDMDAIVFYDKPLLKFERLLETYYANAPKGLSSFIVSMPVWLKEKMFLKKLIKDELKKIEEYDKKKLRLLFPEHHLSHAASAFYPSPYEEAAILTIDGVGEWATASICYGNKEKIEVLKELNFPHSLGLLYSAFTYYLGFRVNSGEYKLMGLAPYGNYDSNTVDHYKNIIKEHLVEIKEDGSVWLNQKYFKYSTGLKMIKESKWEQLFGVPTRKSEQSFTQDHSDIALAIQQVTEEIVIKMAMTAKKITGSKNLCMAGGVALNCVANGKLLDDNKIFENIFVQPAAGDAGGALGAAFAAYHIYFEQERSLSENDKMKGSLLGPAISDKDIDKIIRKYKAVSHKLKVFDDVCDKTAQLIDEGKIIGWVQERMEFGPRALGARSILGDARNPEMQKKLNLKIKYRESFRPFAPAILSTEATKYFDIEHSSPYMLFVRPVKKELRNKLPENYDSLDLKEKLYVQRSSFPAITHVDFSARIQTVNPSNNKKFHALISKFFELTGSPIIVNTSFNVRGEPIVNTPEDAYRCFMRTEMDVLVMNNYIFYKEEQPEWEKTDNWKEEFVLD